MEEKALRTGKRMKHPDAWRLASFTKDLSIGLKGGIGVLFAAGTATVRLYWRKRKPATYHTADSKYEIESPTASTQNSQDTEEGSVPALSLDSQMNEEELKREIEPILTAVESTKKISDMERFRREFFALAKQFQSMARVFETANYSEWFVSRYRVDLPVEASGKVSPGVSIGADVRLRLKWHRLKMKETAARPGPRQSHAAKSLKEFVEIVSEDLREVSQQFHSERGFYPHTIRVGVGISAKGTVGIAKVGGALVGQIYFAKDVPKPLSLYSDRGILPWRKFIPVIETTPSTSTLHYAKENGIGYELLPAGTNRSSVEQVVYKIPRARFRKGLERAGRMSVKMAERASRLTKGKCGIYELRVAFDLSVGGSLGLVDIAGLGTAQISLYNANFNKP